MRKIKVSCQHMTKVVLSRKGNIPRYYGKLEINCFKISVLLRFVFVFFAFENEGIHRQKI